MWASGGESNAACCWTDRVHPNLVGRKLISHNSRELEETALRCGVGYGIDATAMPRRRANVDNSATAILAYHLFRGVPAAQERSRQTYVQGPMPTVQIMIKQISQWRNGGIVD